MLCLLSENNVQNVSNNEVNLPRFSKVLSFASFKEKVVYQ